jgi:hypothetical protein
MLLTVGSIPRSTDNTLHQFQQMFPEPVGTLSGGSGVPPGGQKFAGLVAGSER